jgi:hypothetical protein
MRHRGPSEVVLWKTSILRRRADGRSTSAGGIVGFIGVYAMNPTIAQRIALVTALHVPVLQPNEKRSGSPS